LTPNEEEEEEEAAAPPHHGLPLPEECLARVLGCLAEQAADPYGLVGPSLAARDIANASLVCWCVGVCFVMAAKGVFCPCNHTLSLSLTHTIPPPSFK
jgi:hypothetical protein